MDIFYFYQQDFKRQNVSRDLFYNLSSPLTVNHCQPLREDSHKREPYKLISVLNYILHIHTYFITFSQGDFSKIITTNNKINIPSFSRRKQ